MDVITTFRAVLETGIGPSTLKEIAIGGPIGRYESTGGCRPIAAALDATPHRHSSQPHALHHGWDIDLMTDRATIPEDTAGWRNRREKGLIALFATTSWSTTRCICAVWFANSVDAVHNIVMTGYQPILMNGWGKSVDLISSHSGGVDQRQGNRCTSGGSRELHRSTTRKLLPWQPIRLHYRSGL